MISGEIEVNHFAFFRLILEAKDYDDPLVKLTFCLYYTQLSFFGIQSKATCYVVLNDTSNKHTINGFKNKLVFKLNITHLKFKRLVHVFTDQGRRSLLQQHFYRCRKIPLLAAVNKVLDRFDKPSIKYFTWLDIRTDIEELYYRCGFF